MAGKCKLDRVCCLSLSKGCLLFGFLDLAANIYCIVYFSILVHKTPNTEYTFTLVTSVIGVSTCSLMICGSIMEYCSLLIPHIVWEFFCTVLFAIGGLWRSVTFLIYESVLLGLMITAIVCCILLLCIYYWSVMYYRYLEIKEKQSAQPDLIEMA